MFRYNKAVKAFKNDCDSFKTPYDVHNKVVNDTEPSGKHNAKRVIRIAACTAVAAALVITGTLSFPMLSQSPKNDNSFGIVANAEDAPKGKVMTENERVKLSPDKVKPAEKSSNENIEIAYKITDCFKVEGNNIQSITYAANHDQLELMDTNWKPVTPYCKFDIPMSMFHSSDMYGEFMQMWAKGDFDQYKKKYFADTELDSPIYNVGFGSVDRKNNKVAVMIFTVGSIMASGDPIVQYGNTITVAGDKQNFVVVVVQDGYKVYSDTNIDVTVTFNDGSKQTKTVGIVYDSLGIPFLTLK
jgi:hypothetical protein